MRLRINAWLVAASAIATLAGCEPPGEISPVAPPGFEYPRTQGVVKDEEAQALGETATVATPKQPPAKSESAEQPSAAPAVKQPEVKPESAEPTPPPK